MLSQLKLPEPVRAAEGFTLTTAGVKVANFC
jgi:hypothetical protein